MKKAIPFSLIAVLLSLLSGCLYPDKENQNQLHEEHINQVQKAVDRFQEDNGGILPLKNKEHETDLYMKYLVDFKRLIPQYLSEPPASAFENGGKYQYVLIDVETKPKVKVFDLSIAEKIREINMRIAAQKYPPYKQVISKNAFTLDFTELGYESEPYIVSPFTGENLPFIINGAGEIFVDYSIDLYLKMEAGDHYSFAQGDDIRFILAEDSFFVPAYSPAYTINESGEPVYLDEK